MISGISIFTAVILFLLNYLLVKYSMVCLESKRMRTTSDLKTNRNNDFKRLGKVEDGAIDALPILNKWYGRESQRMKLAGKDIGKCSVLMVLLKLILPILIIVKGIVCEGISSPGALAFVLPIAAYEMLMRKSISKKEMAFQKNAYKIYKYLLNQSLAGVKPSDCLKTLHHVVEDKFLKHRLLMMSVVFSRTMEIDLALLELKDYYELPEVENLCIAIKQGIDTGENVSVLMRQEEMMFKKYFNYIQMETDRQKFRALIVVTVFSFIMILMIGVPLFFQLVLATESIFI